MPSWGLVHAPGDWLASRTNARQRCSIATWLLIAYCAMLPLRYAFKDRVWMVWLLSEIAIVISLATIVAAETPVEEE
jgi:hypothetical protein